MPIKGRSFINDLILNGDQRVHNVKDLNYELKKKKPKATRLASEKSLRHLDNQVVFNLASVHEAMISSLT